MTKHHLNRREKGWRRKLFFNLSAGIMSTVVVGIFLVAKFTEGAWLIAIVFPLLFFVFLRLNAEYRAESAILRKFRANCAGQKTHDSHRMFVCVKTVDLATLETLRYGRGLEADELAAVHFMADAEQARLLRKLWEQFDLDVPLRIIDCPDRLLTRAARDLVNTAQEEHPGTQVTLLLPRRTYGAFFGRLLHARNADKIAEAVSRTPNAAATIVPYDVDSRIGEEFPHKLEQRLTRRFTHMQARLWRDEHEHVASFEHPARTSAVTAVNKLIPERSATIEGRVNEVEDRIDRRQTRRSILVSDATGKVRIDFSGHDGGSDIQPGAKIRLTGVARHQDGARALIVDPDYLVIEASPNSL